MPSTLEEYPICYISIPCLSPSLFSHGPNIKLWTRRVHGHGTALSFDIDRLLTPLMILLQTTPAIWVCNLWLPVNQVH